jgi:hypothetical protein
VSVSPRATDFAVCRLRVVHLLEAGLHRGAVRGNIGALDNGWRDAVCEDVVYNLVAVWLRDMQLGHWPLGPLCSHRIRYITHTRGC